MSNLWEIGTGNEKTSTEKNSFQNATTAQEIIAALSKEGKPPIPTLSDIQNFTAPTTDDDWIVFVGHEGSRYDVYTQSDYEKMMQQMERFDQGIERAWNRFLQSEDGKAYQQMSETERDAWEAEMLASYQEALDYYQEMQETEKKDRPESENLAPGEDFRNHFYKVDPKHFQPITNYILRTAGEPTEERLEWLHTAWIKALEENPHLKHPLAPIIQAWTQEQNAKHVTKAYDQKHPVAVLKYPLGSIRELTFVDADAAQLREFATPESVKQVDSQQVFDFARYPPSVLSDITPLEVTHPGDLPLTTKKGAVSHVLRIFDEALMALEPRETRADIMFTLGDLISCLYPDGKFNRTNQLPYIINALEVLHFYATVPWDNGQGRWRPVVVRTPLAPDAKNDAKIFLDVKLPPDARQGMMVEKAILRQLGKESAPKYHAYRTACWLWDKYGTTPKGLIDPTRPVEKRNDTGQLVDSTGNVIVTPRGKAITNTYHQRAISQLDRERNPAADRYPVLSDNDLILACKPHGLDPKSRARELERAKKHWRDLESRGIVVIVEERDGWRIMPSETHLRAYRGLQKASKKSMGKSLLDG